MLESRLLPPLSTCQEETNHSIWKMDTSPAPRLKRDFTMSRLEESRHLETPFKLLEPKLPSLTQPEAHVWPTEPCWLLLLPNPLSLKCGWVFHLWTSQATPLWPSQQNLMMMTMMMMIAVLWLSQDSLASLSWASSTCSTEEIYYKLINKFLSLFYSFNI